MVTALLEVVSLLGRLEMCGRLLLRLLLLLLGVDGRRPVAMD